jgi:hypothetical protein
MYTDHMMENSEKAAKGKVAFGDNINVPTAMKLAGFSNISTYDKVKTK